jgi:hypothetical protein
MHREELVGKVMHSSYSYIKQSHEDNRIFFKSQVICAD